MSEGQPPIKEAAHGKSTREAPQESEARYSQSARPTAPPPGDQADL